MRTSTLVADLPRCEPSQRIRQMSIVGTWGARVVMLALLFSDRALGDSIFLLGGEKLIGKVRAEKPRKVIFESRTLGRIEVPRANIEKIEIDAARPKPETVSPGQTAPFPVSGRLTNQFNPWSSGGSVGDSFDWIQLKSGEWLKGRMKSMQDEQLEFDSEEMDLQEFDWEDIRTLRLPRLNAVRLETIGSMTGSLLVSTNQAVVLGATTNTYPRSELISITPTGKREINNWSAKVSAGLSFRSGNTKQLDYNAQVAIDRRTPYTHFSLDYLGNFGSVDDEETANNHRITTEFDYFLSRRLFVVVPFVEYYRDPLQNLEHRLTEAVGVGYDLFKSRRLEWNVVAGLGYQKNWFTSVAAGTSEQPGAFALLLSSKLEIELTKQLDFLTELRAQITSKEVGETTYHGLATLEFEIHKHLDLEISLIWDRISNPQTDASGFTPLKDDFRLVTGLGVNF